MRFFNPRALAVALTALFSFSLAASAAPGVVLKIGSLVPVDSPWGKVIITTIRRIKERTGGAVEVQFFHTGRLGGEADMLSQMLIGGLDGAGLTSAALTSLERGFMLLEFPYLFKDFGEAHYVMDKAIYPELSRRLKSRNLHTVDFMENGFMQLITKGPVNRVEDLRKLKIGSWESPVQMAFWKNLGASARALAVTEVPSAYATGLVNAGANGFSAAASFDFVLGSAVKRPTIYITHTDHLFQAGVLVFSNGSLNRVPKNQQAILLGELKSMAQVIRQQVPKDEAAAVAKLKRLKYNVVEPAPELVKQLKAAGAKTTRDLAPRVGKGFYQKVLKTQAVYRKSHK